MPKDQRPAYYAVVDFLSNRVYYGTYDKFKEQCHLPGKKFNSVEEAARYCETEAYRRGELYHDKHLTIYDLEKNTEMMYDDMLLASHRARLAADRAMTAAASSGAAASSSSSASTISAIDQLEAIASDDEFVEKLLEVNFSLLRNAKGQGAIHFAAIRGFPKAIQFMAADGYDLDTQDDEGYTALHYAAKLHHADCIQMLIQKKARCDLREKSGSNSQALSFLTADLKGRSPEYIAEVQALSELFPCAETKNFLVKFEKQAEGIVVIKEIQFNRRSSSISQELAINYPHCYIKNDLGLDKLKPGLQVRHIHSDKSIADSLIKQFTGMPYQEAIKQLCTALGYEEPRPISTMHVAEYMAKLYQNRSYGIGNLFVGDRTENQAYGWLMGQLDFNTNQFPHIIVIDPQYLSVFKRNPCYSEFYKEGRLVISDASALERLRALAHHDDPAFANIPKPEASASSAAGSLALASSGISAPTAKATGAKRAFSLAFSEAEASHSRNVKPARGQQPNPGSSGH
jgi:hypothetical protein